MLVYYLSTLFLSNLTGMLLTVRVVEIIRMNNERLTRAHSTDRTYS